MKNYEEIQTRKKLKIDLLICLINAILIEVYFITTNIVSRLIPIQSFDIYIQISYMIFVIIAVLMLEIAHKKGKKNFVIYGIELILLAIHILLIGKDITLTTKNNILSTSYIWIVYYCLKALLIYTKENRRRLRQISDISEIVKEEKPTKKVAKKRKS